MANAVILIADNSQDFLHIRSQFLEREGFTVLKAQCPEETRAVLERGRVELAIIDIRLINDDDERDFSGLNLAKRLAPDVPKIILTRYPTPEAVREALAPQLKGLPAAVDFVAKQEGPQALLTAVRRALKASGNRYLTTMNDLSGMIREDYDDARQQARVNYWASLVVSIGGVMIIFAGIGLTMARTLELGIPSVITGIITEAASLMFFKRADNANRRMDRYHRELLEIRRFDNLMAASEELSPEERQQATIAGLIETAVAAWLGENATQHPVGE
jgi:CheY-like chemotaxis protein